jgi:hypothetical protein
MTLAAMWIEAREPRGAETGRLCFASDSRTTPGPIEGVAKVLSFSRPDIAGVWAGDVRYAALLSNHLDIVLSATSDMRDRTIDVGRLLRSAQRKVEVHLARTTSASVQPWELNPLAQEPTHTTMLVGGFSIEEAAFYMMRIGWDRSKGRWRASVKVVDPSEVIWIGERRQCNRAKGLVKKLRAHRSADAADWRMEPLAGIDYCRRDPAAISVGGDLQLAKAFRHGAVSSYAILEPLESEASVRGTKLTGAAIDEYRARNLLVDLSRWSLGDSAFGAAWADPPAVPRS